MVYIFRPWSKTLNKDKIKVDENNSEVSYNESLDNLQEGNELLSSNSANSTNLASSSQNGDQQIEENISHLPLPHISSLVCRTGSYNEEQISSSQCSEDEEIVKINNRLENNTQPIHYSPNTSPNGQQISSEQHTFNHNALHSIPLPLQYGIAFGINGIPSNSGNNVINMTSMINNTNVAGSSSISSVLANNGNNLTGSYRTNQTSFESHHHQWLQRSNLLLHHGTHATIHPAGFHTGNVPNPLLFPSDLYMSAIPIVQQVHHQEVVSRQIRKMRPKKFRCENCDMAFSNNGQLQGHIRIHTGEKPFKCDFISCKKAFTRNEELTRHRRIHTGERPHLCGFCKKSFGRKDHLKKHMRTHEAHKPLPLSIYPFNQPLNFSQNIQFQQYLHGL